MKNISNNFKKIDSQNLEQVLRLVFSGDEKAFRELYELTKAPIYGYSLSILKNHEEALDNVQDVFVKIYESCDNYDYRGKPMNWIFTITKNFALMRIRKDSKYSCDEFDEKILFSNSISNDDKLILKDMLLELSNEERQIIIMHLIGNLKHHDIAKIMELNLSTTISKYHRALKKLRLRWKEV